MQFSVVLFCLCAGAMAELPEDRSKLVVLAISGLGLEYMKSVFMLPNLRRLYEKSARPEYLEPVFPTKANVNLFSIATGLYAEEHGVISNQLYDDMTENYRTESITPLWIENNINGGNSGVMTWPGLDYNKHTGHYIAAHTQGPPRIPTKERLVCSPPSYKDRVTKIIEWLTHKMLPSNLVMANFGDLDAILRTDGANSERVIEELENIDKAVGFLIEELKKSKYGLKNKVNLIILGTQGMSSARYNGRIRLNDILSDCKCTFTAMGTIAIVTPNDDQWNGVYNVVMKNAKTAEGAHIYDVYERDEMPEKWHLKGLETLSRSLFLVANLGYFFWNEKISEIVQTQVSRTALGKKIESPEHFVACFDGYYNENAITQTFFLATGPDFTPAITVPPFQTIDIYPLLRKLLDLGGFVDGHPTTDVKGPVSQLLSRNSGVTLCKRVKETTKSIYNSFTSKRPLV